MKRVIIFVGFLLIGLAFTSAALISLVALYEGGSSVAYSAAGKPALFLPGYHFFLIIIAVFIVIWVLMRRIIHCVGVRKSERQKEKIKGGQGGN